MHAFDRKEATAADLRIRRERRVLAAVLIVLLVTTALVSPLAFGSLPFLLLLIAPFALALLFSVMVAPLSVSAAAARAARQEQAALHSVRAADAARHAIRVPRRDTLAPDDPAVLAAAVAAAAAHGIHFGCAHLSDEDFLQSFHAGEIRAAEFRHGDHLRYTVLMLQRVPAGLAEETIAKNLRTFLRQVCGSEALFHSTRTHAWVAVLRSLPRAGFAHTLQSNGHDLRGDGLSRFYSNERLQSEEARRRPMPPDREPLPPPYAPIRSSTNPASAPPSSGPSTGTHA